MSLGFTSTSIAEVAIPPYIDYFEEKRSKSLLMRRLRKLFGRSYPEKEEVAILRGILTSIKPYNKKPD